VVNDRVLVTEGGDASRPSKANGSAPPDVMSLSKVEGDEGKGGKAVYFKKVRGCAAPSAQHILASWDAWSSFWAAGVEGTMRLSNCVSPRQTQTV
jgi:hypothetical protein